MTVGIAFVDLDGTLLAGVGAEPEAIPREAFIVDRGTNGARSMVARSVPDLLRPLIERGSLVPTTARDRTQLSRLTGMWPMLPEWCIAACGAVILHHGEEVAGWTDVVRRQVQQLSVGVGDVAASIAAAVPGAKVRIVHDAVIVAVLATRWPAIAGDLSIRGWRFRQSGRKLYALPGDVDKAAAADAVARWVGAERVVAAGDSDLDLELLRRADVALIPAGSELDRPDVRGGLGPVVVPVDPDRPGAAMASAIVEALAAGPFDPFTRTEPIKELSS